MDNEVAAGAAALGVGAAVGAGVAALGGQQKKLPSPPKTIDDLYNLLLQNGQILSQILDALNQQANRVSTWQLRRPKGVGFYSVTTDPTPNKTTELIFKKIAVWMIIDNNLASANDILVSFDAGTKFKTIRAGVVLNFSPYTLPLPEDFDRITHKSAAASTSFEILTGELV